jgi:hypothetical protein
MVNGLRGSTVEMNEKRIVLEKPSTGNDDC